RCSRSAMSTGGSGASVRHLLLPFRAKLAVGVPLRPLLAVGELRADFVERLRVFGYARKIPIRIEVVLRRVVAMRGVIGECSSACRGAALHLVIAGLAHQRGHAGFGKAEMIGAVVEAILRRGIGAGIAALLFQRGF